MSRRAPQLLGCLKYFPGGDLPVGSFLEFPGRLSTFPLQLFSRSTQKLARLGYGTLNKNLTDRETSALQTAYAVERLVVEPGHRPRRRIFFDFRHAGGAGQRNRDRLIC